MKTSMKKEIVIVLCIVLMCLPGCGDDPPGRVEARPGSPWSALHAAVLLHQEYGLLTEICYGILDGNAFWTAREIGSQRYAMWQGCSFRLLAQDGFIEVETWTVLGFIDYMGYLSIDSDGSTLRWPCYSSFE